MPHNNSPYLFFARSLASAAGSAQGTLKPVVPAAVSVTDISGGGNNNYDANPNARHQQQEHPSVSPSHRR